MHSEKQSKASLR